MTSPLGVNTYTSAVLIWYLRESRKSEESLASSCHETSELSQFSSPSLALGVAEFAWLTLSLYFQCAATPYSARRCISWVRIWISTGRPFGPITVVCSDWYMLNLGIAM